VPKGKKRGEITVNFKIVTVKASNFPFHLDFTRFLAKIRSSIGEFGTKMNRAKCADINFSPIFDSLCFMVKVGTTHSMLASLLDRKFRKFP
jgi:hypothetical protein